MVQMSLGFSTLNFDYALKKRLIAYFSSARCFTSNFYIMEGIDRFSCEYINSVNRHHAKRTAIITKPDTSKQSSAHNHLPIEILQIYKIFFL